MTLKVCESVSESTFLCIDTRSMVEFENVN